MIMAQPHFQNMIKLLSTKTHEGVEAFALQRLDERLAKRIRLRRPPEDTDTSHIRLPESVEFVRIFSIPVANRKSRMNAFALHPR